jgi:hypothetical protein
MTIFPGRSTTIHWITKFNAKARITATWAIKRYGHAFAPWNGIAVSIRDAFTAAAAPSGIQIYEFHGV